MTVRRVSGTAPSLLLAAMLLATFPGALGAQALRHYTTTRQFNGETHLAATVEFAGGSLQLGAGKPGALYGMELKYDPTRSQPVSSWDSARSLVRLGLSSLDNGSVGMGSGGPRQSGSITFTPQADLDLTLRTGAAETRVDFGGLRLASLVVETGASTTDVTFSKPNPMRCREARFTAGAAELRVTGLGQSHCEAVSFKGGVGTVVLDYAGSWRGRTALQADLAVGGLTLRIPREVGVVITTEKFLTSFQPAGFTREGNQYTSTNQGTAGRFLDVALTTSLGGVTVEWTD